MVPPQSQTVELSVESGETGCIDANLCRALLKVEVGIQVWATSGEKRYFNPATLKQFGAIADIDGANYEVLANLCVDDNGLAFGRNKFPVAQVMHTRASSNDVLARLVDTNASIRWLRISAQPLFDGSSGEFSGIISSTVDVTAFVEQSHQLTTQAHYDILTRLPNRALLADRMKQALAHSQRSGEMLAVCLMDLDGFKPVNDKLGHKAGDAVLQEVARRLQDSIRADDTAARIGGDEFALVLGGIKSAEQCESTLRRLLDTIAVPLSFEGKAIRVSGSIGVALFPGDSKEPEQLLRHADQAMYKAKESGKNRFHIFNPAVESRLRANHSLLKRIEDALDHGQFCLYYQPKVDCRAGKVVGLEALIRWQHPVLGLRTPAEFIPLIEHDDIVVRLGEWVIQESLRQMVAWQHQGIFLDISVNVSVRQFLRGGFDNRLTEILSQYTAEVAHHLEIELVETAALEDINAVSAVMTHQQACGVRFSLDDFGTGYSSLIHLKRLAVNELKIDQTFVRDMLDDPGDLAIVQGVIGLASAFRHQVVAEGVENIEQILMLLELGCDVMQGYGIARPMPAANVLPWVTGFQSDPRWSVASSHFPVRSDFELLLMEVAHRHWLERLRSTSLQTSDRPPPEYDHCRLSQWYEGAGRKRYGQLPEFCAIDGPHREVHRLAETLIASYRDGDDQLLKATLGAIEEQSGNLLASMHQLRLALAGNLAFH
jgi:diguanylate cyclase (GGDEF)-like protein